MTVKISNVVNATCSIIASPVTFPSLKTFTKSDMPRNCAALRTCQNTSMPISNAAPKCACSASTPWRGLGRYLDALRLLLASGPRADTIC